MALRNIYRNKVYSLLNVAGLAVGIACSIIIALYLKNELTYDQHHQKAAQIYRVGSRFDISGKVDEIALSSRMLGPILKDEYEEIEEYTRFRWIPRILVRHGEKRFYEEKMLFADSTVFDLFDFEFLAGSPKNSLGNPNSIIITRSFSQRYFGQENPVGKILSTDRHEYRVRAMIADPPANSHLKFAALLPYARLDQSLPLPEDEEERKGELWSVSVYTYLLMRPDFVPETFDQISRSLYTRHMKFIGDQINGKAEFTIEPLARIHYGSAMAYDRFEYGNSTYLYSFFAIGIFILLLAIINYMNMATARSSSRAREVGMRKVLGGNRGQLINQFLGEAVIMSLIAFGFALVLVELILSLSPFNRLIGSELSLAPGGNWPFLLVCLAGAIGVGIISGSYPAFYLSSIIPAKALKGTRKSGKTGLLVRRGLVTFQFAVSIGVIVCTWLMYNQIDYVRSRDLGFNQENLLLIPLQDSTLARKAPEIRDELVTHEGISAGAIASDVPGTGISLMLFRAEGRENMEEHIFNVMFVGMGYLETMGLHLLEGQDFQPENQSEAGAHFLVNQELVRKMGWENGLGKHLQAQLNLDGNAQMDGHVQGVVEDFNVKSLHEGIQPLVLVLQDQPSGVLHLRLSGQNIHGTMDYIRQKWEEFDPDRPFDYSFLDQDFSELYARDNRQSTLLAILAFVCVFISCLGLLGLASYSIQQRTREIGIRKVLGASVLQIVFMLFRDFLVLVGIAALLASPVAWLVVRPWIHSFAYQAGIPWYVFIITALGAVLVAFITVGFHSLRAAQANPVQSLKYE